MKQPNWIKNGKQVKGKYCEQFDFHGTITNTRVCYGTDIEYRVQLTNPIEVYGEVRHVILIRKEKDQKNFTFV